ncbi:MAG: CDP-archaeol synthase, partial [Methyloprofundus sp.]|nr:CDP-archaeol synthase [Methyloprofundus sp.]
GTPILARNFFKTRYAWSIDFGIDFIDHRPLFGDSKTWRGLIASVFMAGVLALLLSMTFQVGVLFGILVMLGDLSASFIKRRLGYIESSRSRFLDTLPESILPVLVLHEQLGLTLFDGILSIALFVILEILISPILYRLHIRKRPY